MGQMIFSHCGKCVGSFKRGDVIRFGKCQFPSYLANWQDALNMLLMFLLIAMLCTEPIIHCSSDEDVDMFTDACDGVVDITPIYYTLNMIAMVLYYVLLLDLAVFNNRISAYVLVCGRMLSEVALFILAIGCVLLTLSSALSCLQQSDPAFKTIPKGFQSMWEMLLRMFSTDHYKSLHDEP